jgi:transcriptional regulator of acetoin/glycerol metabolism
MRCLQSGQEPQQPAVFERVSAAQSLRAQDANRGLIEAAKPILEKLGKAIANTRYFAILTNSDGVVVDTSGAIDRSDPRANQITRIGTDLSERSVGTTAIGTALSELQPVWLHQGEHFFPNTSIYSCAGAPLIGPNGTCVGMLDVTGIEALERPELKHLVTQTAGRIENALVLGQPHHLLLRLNWPGNALGGDADGIVCLDAEGWITAANSTARLMVPALNASNRQQQSERVHASDLFGVPFEMLFDAVRRHDPIIDLPLWTGLRLQALPILRTSNSCATGATARPIMRNTLALKDIESALIHQAVDQARGNVALAAQTLGISRATLYRKLGHKQHKS